jgi:7-cyano-7-deazaguanine synthase
MFVDYGQRPARSEETSARAIARHYKIAFHKVSCAGPRTDFRGEIAGRNAFLILSALLFRPQSAGLISLGIHAGTPYYDCTELFAQQIGKILDTYSDGRLALGTPFLSWRKDRIWAFCKENDVPVAMTWSCEVGPARPCGKCLSCIDRKALYACSPH